MRAYLPGYEIRRAASLAEVLAVLRDEPGVWKPFAGGTDLMVVLEAGKLAHRNFVSIWGLAELQGIQESKEFVTIGALSTYTQIQKNATLAREFPLLCQAGQETGAIAIQNRGTLGGNIANASPAADSPPALLVYDAQVELSSASGSRWVPYSGFHTGYKATQLRPDELLTKIRVPRRERGFQYYRKVGTRKAQAISKVCFAGTARLKDGKILESAIALGSVAPTALRCFRTETVLKGKALTPALIEQARQTILGEVKPIDDIRSTSLFRAKVSANLIQDFLDRLAASVQ
ncbi:MAG: FAD binding domain-containing protein [Bdellovibrionota bacterium]